MFSEHGLIGMIEAFDFEPIDQVSSFLKAITDRMCGNDPEPELTELFISFDELFKISLTRGYLFFSDRDPSSLFTANDCKV